MKNKLFFKHILLLIATTTLVSLLSVLILHNTVFAAAIPADLKESSEAIQKMAAECYETEHSKKPDQITIDYDSAYGIYIDVDLFSGSSKSFREVMDLCAKAPMCYIVPIQADGQTAIVEVSKGLPLNTSTSSLITEEEKEEIKSNEGKWIPASLTFETTPQSTEQQVHELLDKKVGSVIEIPASVEKIEPFAFSGNIKEMISHAKAPFGMMVFNENCKIKNLTVPEGTEISDMAFGMWPEAMKKVPNLKIRYL